MIKMIKITILSIVTIFFISGCTKTNGVMFVDTAVIQPELKPDISKVESVKVQIIDKTEDIKTSDMFAIWTFDHTKKENEAVALLSFSNYFKDVSIDDGGDLVIETKITDFKYAPTYTTVAHPLSILAQSDIYMHIKVTYKGQVIIDKPYFTEEKLESLNQLISIMVMVQGSFKLTAYNIYDIYEKQLIPDIIEKLK